MSSCSTCKYARQVGDKKRQDVVGCVLLNGNPCDSLAPPVITTNMVKNSNIYEGYVYFGRMVGDVAESKTFGKGTITLGLIVDSTGYCEEYDEWK